MLDIFKQISEDKKDIQLKMRVGKDHELKDKYKIVRPL